jgi:glycosyltransferase involved in cell wall biosynthesis
MLKKLIIFMPSVEGGGVEKNLFIVANYLAKNLNKIALISANTNIKNLLNKKIEFICPKSNFWNNKARRMKYLLCLYFLIKQIINNNNITILTFQANIYAIFIAKLFGIKIISRSNSSPTGWSKNIIKTFIFKVVLKKADQIIVNSYDFKKELKNKFNVNSICIYNPLNKQQIIKLSKIKKFNSWLKNNKNKLNIINVGRFTDQKDHITLIKAISLIKDKISMKVLIIGRGINRKIMIKEILKNNLNKIIKIISFQKNPFPYFLNANLFILTSKFEGLPNVLLEAQTLKKFVISSNCPTGPREILKNGKLGYLFEIGNAQDLSEKILLFYKNRKKLHKIINLGYYSLNRFDFNSNLKKYLKTVKLFLN